MQKQGQIVHGQRSGLRNEKIVKCIFWQIQNKDCRKSRFINEKKMTFDFFIYKKSLFSIGKILHKNLEVKSLLVTDTP